MTTFIGLATFTEQGLRTVRDTTKRAEAVREMAGKYGVRVRDILWTQGRYDLVTVIEADDEQAGAAFSLAVAAAGNVRFETMRAFTREEMAGILQRI